jgi:pentatricopeptide repeat protein
MDGRESRVHELTREIAGHAQRKQLAGALAAFDRLLAEGHEPNVFAHCALVNAHASCADMPGALRACLHMVEARVPPNAVVLTTLLKGYVNAGETERAYGLLLEMAGGGDGDGDGSAAAAPPRHAAAGAGAGSIWAGCARVRPDTRAINTLLRGCMRTGHVDLATSLAERMVSVWHLEPDLTTFKLLAKCHAMANDARSLEALAERLLAPAEAEPADAAAPAAQLGPAGPVCMFWREGRNSCPRGSQCRFRHPAHILQLGGGAGTRATRRGGGADGGPEADELDAVPVGRSAFFCELRLLQGHAHALNGDWASALAALALAEGCLHEATEEARAKEPHADEAAAGADGHWYAQLALQEFKRELHRVGVHARSGLAREGGGGAGGARSRREGGGAFDADPRAVLARTFLFDAVSTAASPQPPSARLGDAVAQRCFALLRRGLGLDAACLAHARGSQAGRKAGRRAQREALEAFAARYATRFGAHTGALRLRAVFEPSAPPDAQPSAPPAAGADGRADGRQRGSRDRAPAPLLPLHVEMGSGNGDWVVAQASATRGAALWLASELRFDRVWQAVSRAHTARADNLAVCGGDSLHVLRALLPAGSVAHLFVNFPEPPHHSGDAHAESAAELLSASFFAAAHVALGQSGRLTILSDSHAYARTLARTLGGLRDAAGARRFVPTHELVRAAAAAAAAGSAAAAAAAAAVVEWDSGGAREDVGGVAVHHGVPGKAQGHHVRAASYFDRFWEHGHHEERFFIDVTRSAP